MVVTLVLSPCSCGRKGKTLTANTGALPLPLPLLLSSWPVDLKCRSPYSHLVFFQGTLQKGREPVSGLQDGDCPVTLLWCT